MINETFKTSRYHIFNRMNTRQILDQIHMGDSFHGYFMSWTVDTLYFLSFTQQGQASSRSEWPCCWNRLTEETSSFTPPNKPESERWISRDVPALAARLATAPIFVDLEAGVADPYSFLMCIRIQHFRLNRYRSVILGF
jgi:hypothetical protein